MELVKPEYLSVNRVYVLKVVRTSWFYVLVNAVAGLR